MCYHPLQPNTAISNSTVTEVTENQPQIVQVQSLQGQTASTSTEQQINPIQQITLQQPTQQSANATTASDVTTSSQQNATTQVIQQVLTPSGEVQNIPVSNKNNITSTYKLGPELFTQLTIRFTLLAIRFN